MFGFQHYLCGKPATIIEVAEQGTVDIFISEAIVEEIGQVLNYPKIKNQKYHSQSTHQQLMEQILRNVEFIEIATELKIIKDHPADDKIIECAASAKADYIISVTNICLL